MKQCPRCNRNYDDDALSFCLEDGSRLVKKYEPEATMVNPNPPMPFVPPTVPYGRGPVEPPAAPRKSPWMIGALVVLALAVGLTIGGMIFQRTSSSSPASPSVASDLDPAATNTPTRAPVTSAPSPASTPVHAAAEERTSNVAQSTQVQGPECVLYNNKSDKSVIRVRTNCDTRDCDNDESTILGEYPDNTPVSVINGSNVQGPRFTWVKVIITGSGRTVWVASSKIKCT